MASPMARQQIKKLAAVTTGSAGQPAFPARWFERFPSYSPRGPGFLAPVARRSFCPLGISVGMPGPHDFAVRNRIIRLRNNAPDATAPIASRFQRP